MLTIMMSFSATVLVIDLIEEIATLGEERQAIRRESL
jgi:hypothetical protein